MTPEAGLDWAGIDGMTDDALEAALYRRPAVAGPRGTRPQPDCVYLHTERRKPGVTLELLHLEYLERHPDGYRYTQFCDIYRKWLGRRRLTMRQVHRGGEKGFVDYAGKTPCLTDPATGERERDACDGQRSGGGSARDLARAGARRQADHRDQAFREEIAQLGNRHGPLD